MVHTKNGKYFFFYIFGAFKSSIQHTNINKNLSFSISYVWLQLGVNIIANISVILVMNIIAVMIQAVGPIKCGEGGNYARYSFFSYNEK